MSPGHAIERELEPLQLLSRIHSVEGTQRELTLTLTHTTDRFTGAVSSLKDEIQRLSEIGERQVQQNMLAQERRDSTLATLTKQANELRGSIRTVGVLGTFVIALVVAYLQLQNNTLSDRISRNEAAIQELRHK